MHSYAAIDIGPLAHDSADHSGAHDQENEPNGGHAQKHTGHKSEAAPRSSSRSPPSVATPSPFPPMAPEEDSGRGESREYHERGGEAAFDEPSRGHTQPPQPTLSRAASISTTDSKISASSSSIGEFDPSKVYVENLPLPISETQLRDLFQQFGGITRIHIGTDRLTKAQLGFGFVEFAQDHQGLTAIATMHQREVNGRIIRCSQAKRRSSPNAPPSGPVSAPAMWQTSQPLLGTTGTAAAQPMNAGQAMMAGTSMDAHGMQQQQPQPFMMLNPALMGGMGMMPQHMASMAPGTAGMMMQTPMGMMPLMMMMPAPVASTPAAATPTPAAAQPAYGRHEAPASPNLFINGIPFAYTESDLKSLFEAFGTLVSTKILLDSSGKSKGQGFVHFENQISAQAAIQAWNGKKPPHGETYLQVRYALPRKTGSVASAVPQQQPSTAPEPLLQFAASHGVTGAAGGGGGDASSGYGPDRKGRGHLGQKHDPLARPAPSAAATGASTLSASHSAPAVTASPSLTANGPDSTTLFIYHVPKGLTNDELQTLFSQHGGVISVSIPRDSNNENKGFAFAKMQTMADAHNAMNALQGHEIQGKRLKVSFKTERPAATGIVLPPGSVASNTAALIAQAQAQAAQQQQQAAAAAAQQQQMMMGGMMYNPAMMMGGGAITPQQQPQQQQQMQIMQMQQMQQMGQMQQPGGAGAMQPGMQMGMMQPMTAGYGMQPGQSGGGPAAQPAAQAPMAGGFGMQQMYQPSHMQPQQPQQQPYQPYPGFYQSAHAHSQPQ